MGLEKIIVARYSAEREKNMVKEVIVEYVWSIIGLLVVFGSGIFFKWLKVKLAEIQAKVDAWADTQIKKQIVDASVKMVEQLSKAIKATSEEKFNQAVANADRLLKEKGLSYSNNELKTLIESAVQEFTNK